MYEQYGGEDEPLNEYEWVYSRVVLAEKFGWTLDYIDNLSMQDVAEVFGVLNGQAKRRAYQREQAEKRRKR